VFISVELVTSCLTGSNHCSFAPLAVEAPVGNLHREGESQSYGGPSKSTSDEKRVIPVAFIAVRVSKFQALYGAINTFVLTPNSCSILSIDCERRFVCSWAVKVEKSS
jgi:hypothetical protein